MFVCSELYNFVMLIIEWHSPVKRAVLWFSGSQESIDDMTGKIEHAFVEHPKLSSSHIVMRAAEAL